MAVPSSGELKLWNDIWNNEIGGTQGENSLHSASVYAGFTTPDAMSDFYGWSDVEAPSVNTNSISSVGTTSMTLNGCVTNTGNENPSRGFYHGTNSSAANNNTKYTLGGTQGVGAFNCTRSSLSQATTYYAWAFACNSAGESQGGRVQAQTTFSPNIGSVQGSEWHVEQGCVTLFTDYRNPISGAYTNYNSTTAFGNVGNNCKVNNATNRARGIGNGNSFSCSQMFRCVQVGGGQQQNIVGHTNSTPGAQFSNTNNWFYNFYTSPPAPHSSGQGISVCQNYSDIRLKTNINYI